MKNFTKLILLLLFICHLPQIITGQSNRFIRGTVVDVVGEVLIGVKIQIKGTKISTRSSEDGEYSLQVPNSKDVLEFSFVGYKSKSKSLNASNVLNIVLEETCTILRTLEVIYYPYEPFLSKGKGAYRYGTSLNQQLEFSKANLNQGIHVLTGLNESPGLTVFSEGLNSNTINIRGIPTQKIMIDQIPLYTGVENNLLEDLEISTFKKIQLEKGADFKSGMQHGGHLNIISEHHRPAFSSMVDKGQNGYLKISNSLKLKKTYDECFSRHFYINQSLTESEGHRDNSAFKKHSFTFKGIPEDHDERKRPYTFFLHYASVKKGLPGPIELNDFENNPQMANPLWAELEAFDNHQTGMAGVYKKFLLLEQSQKHGYLFNSSSLFGILNKTERLNPFRLLNNNMLVWGGKTNFEYQKRGKEFSKSYLYGGLEFYNERLAWKTFSPKDLLATEVLNKNVERRTYLDLFLGGNHFFNQKFQISAGFNLNKSLVKTKDKFASDATDYDRKQWFTLVFSPQIEGSYTSYIQNGINYKVIGKISHGLARVPTGSISFRETQHRYFYEPERSWNYELGIGGGKKSLFGIPYFKLEYLASFYFIERKNILSLDNITLQDSYQVDGSAVHTGFELFLKGMSERYGWYGSYNYAPSHYKSLNENGQNYKDNIVPGISPHTLNTGLVVKSSNNKSYFRFNYEYASAKPLTNNNSVYSKRHHLLQTKLGFRFGLGNNISYPMSASRKIKNEINFDIHLGINNILNQQYVSNFRSPNDLQCGGESAIYYPGTPRYSYVGIKVELEDWPKIF